MYLRPSSCAFLPHISPFGENQPWKLHFRIIFFIIQRKLSQPMMLFGNTRQPQSSLFLSTYKSHWSLSDLQIVLLFVSITKTAQTLHFIFRALCWYFLLNNFFWQNDRAKERFIAGNGEKTT